MSVYTRLQKRKSSGIYYCRVAVPKELQHVLGKTEIFRSLKTSNPILARKLVRIESLKIDRLLEDAATDNHSKDNSKQEFKPLLESLDSFEHNFRGSKDTFQQVAENFLSLPERKQLTDKSLFEYKATFRMLGEILGNNTIFDKINRVDCRRVQQIFSILPANSSKHFPTLKLMQIVELAKRNQLEPMAILSANKHLTRLASLFNWAEREGIIQHNPAKSLTLKDTEARKDKRHPFNCDQLKQIFNNNLMFTHKLNDSAHYWIPLIALYTGARLNEICQLDRNDIVQFDGIYCISITNGEGKRLKTANSKRMIPVHPKLIESGLIEYINNNQTSTKLFAELKVSSTGSFSVLWGKKFARYLKNIGIKSNKLCFHSFRHTFRDAMREAGLNREMVQALGGWRDKTAGTEELYGSGFSIQKLYEAICKIDYNMLICSHEKSST